MLSLALTAVATFVAVPAFAQDNFPDVKENHWAYEALENLKREGILVGYPDGTFKGPRAATRYEMAIAINAAYQRLKNITDGLASQIAEIRANMGKGGDKDLADRLAAVEAQLRGMGKMSDDLAAMKKMGDEFQKELASLGVDVEAMKKDIDEMKKGMGGEAPSVRISGDANIVMHAGASEDRTPTFGIDGRWVGLDEERQQITGSIFGDMHIYHEIALNIAGNTKGPKWDATIVYGNLMGGSLISQQQSSTVSRSSTVITTQGYGNQSGRFQGTAFGEGEGDVYIQRFVVDLSETLPFHAYVGRLGFQTANPYLFRRSDNTPYFENARWDDGNWIMDGALLSFDLGKNVNLALVGGRQDKRQTTNGVEIAPVALSSLGIGTGAVDRFALVQNTAGAQLTFGLNDKGSVNVAFVYHGLTAIGEGLLNPIDHSEVMGAGLDYKLSDALGLKAGYGQVVLKNGGTTVNDSDNTAWFASLDYKGDKFKANAGYRRIESAYFAAGDWERIGTFYSPRDVQDFQVGASFDLNSNVNLSARGLFGSFIDSSDYSSIKVDANFAMGGGWMGNLGWEQFSIDGGRGSDPRQRWITAGLRRQLGSDGLFKLVYQYGDHTLSPDGWGMNKARGFKGEAKGHILFGQVSVKF